MASLELLFPREEVVRNIQGLGEDIMSVRYNFNAKFANHHLCIAANNRPLGILGTIVLRSGAPKLLVVCMHFVKEF